MLGHAYWAGLHIVTCLTMANQRHVRNPIADIEAHHPGLQAQPRMVPRDQVTGGSSRSSFTGRGRKSQVVGHEMTCPTGPTPRSLYRAITLTWGSQASPPPRAVAPTIRSRSDARQNVCGRGKRCSASVSRSERCPRESVGRPQYRRGGGRRVGRERTRRGETFCRRTHCLLNVRPPFSLSKAPVAARDILDPAQADAPKGGRPDALCSGARCEEPSYVPYNCLRR